MCSLHLLCVLYFFIYLFIAFSWMGDGGRVWPCVVITFRHLDDTGHCIPFAVSPLGRRFWSTHTDLNCVQIFTYPSFNRCSLDPTCCIALHIYFKHSVAKHAYPTHIHKYAVATLPKRPRRKSFSSPSLPFFAFTFSYLEALSGGKR